MIVLLLVFSSAVSAQVKPTKSYFTSYWTDTKYIVSEPTRWNGNQWLQLGGTLAVAGGLYLIDDDIREWSQNNTSSQSEFISHYLLEPWGSGIYSLGTLGILYLTDGDRGRKVALQGTKAWLLTGGATFVLKQLTHRQRPNDGSEPDPNVWHGPYALTSDFTSFPSGHTSTVWAVATVISKSYNKTWVKIVSYSIASLAGASRIHDDVHWASDVFIGAALGYFVGNSIIKNSSEIDWGVSLNQGVLGGNLVWKF